MLHIKKLGPRLFVNNFDQFIKALSAFHLLRFTEAKNISKWEVGQGNVA